MVGAGRLEREALEERVREVREEVQPDVAARGEDVLERRKQQQDRGGGDEQDRAGQDREGEDNPLARLGLADAVEHGVDEVRDRAGGRKFHTAA